MIKYWKKVLGIAVLTLTISGLAIVPVAMADEGDDSTSTPQPGERCEVFKGKVAGSLGVTTDDLDAAVTGAKLEMIDEAVAAGKIDPEKAEEIKQRIEENGGMCGWMKHRPHCGPAKGHLMDKAVEEGIITQEQADEIASIMEDVKAYCQENGCERDGSNLLEKAVENGIITQEQADQIESIREQVKDWVEENGGLRGFRGRGPCGEGDQMGMQNGGFAQRGFRGGQGMMGMGKAA